MSFTSYKGLDEGVKQMSKNQKVFMDVHFEWAYGYVGYPPIIDPKTDLQVGTLIYTKVANI
jgi:hypothetical protein